MYILFDIGGTKSRLAGTVDRKNFSTPVIFDTPELFSDGMIKFAELSRQIVDGAEIQGASGGITGTLDRDRNYLLRSPNLHGWTKHHIAEGIQKAIGGAPVFIENDAAIVGLGEAVSGAGRGFPIVSYFTVSTGVGGARIVDGHIDEHAYGFEPGQITLDEEGTTLESAVSGTAVTRRFGKKPKEIPQESPLWDELAKTLAVGLHDSLVQWSPDAVVLGGSMIVGDPYIDIGRVAHYLNEKSHVFPKLPAIKKAELGAIGGIFGALAFLTNMLKK